MDKVLLVARWEFMRNFKIKQEIIGYALMLAVYAAMVGLQYWHETKQQDTVHLGVIGQIQAEFPEYIEITPLAEAPASDKVAVTLDQLNLNGILALGEPGIYTLYVKQQATWIEELEISLSNVRRDRLLADMGLTQDQLEQLQNPIDFTLVNQAQEELGSDIQLLGTLVAIITAIAVFNSFGYCLTSVTQEKQHRVTEQLLTCIGFQQWIDGKSLGLCLASLKSLVSTMIFMFLLFLGLNMFVPGTIPNISFSALLALQIFVFCILGIVFWNYFFVGFAATIDDPNHSGKSGIMLLFVLPVLLVFMVIEDPNGVLSVALSIFPMTSISFMPMRLASMEVPVWQLLLSIVLLVASTGLIRLYATRIFRANITLFGKEPTWYQMWKSMKAGD